MTPAEGGRLRVVMLAKGWTGYLDAAFAELARLDVDLTVARPEAMKNTAFDLEQPNGIDFITIDFADPDPRFTEKVLALKPDVVIVHSWEVKPYRRVLRSLPEGVLRLLWMDNISLGTPKQRVGRLIARWYLHPLFDAVMVPSDRSEHFARALGFPASSVIRGCTPADTTIFNSPPRSGDELASRRCFVAALRLVHHKGADVLAEAYRQYRSMTDEPWDLVVAGIGPMAPAFEGLDGVRMLGFQQPGELADQMRRSSCLINPSRVEPYAVVLQEGASCALPILSTDFVGAAPTMVQDGYNGWIIEAGRADLLAEGMLRMSTTTPQRLEEMSAISQAFSRRLSPRGWAVNVREEIDRRLAR